MNINRCIIFLNYILKDYDMEHPKYINNMINNEISIYKNNEDIYTLKIFYKMKYYDRKKYIDILNNLFDTNCTVKDIYLYIQNNINYHEFY